MKKALFLDRDGTIIEHVHYINDPEKVKLIPEMIKKIKSYQQAGYLIIVITNQRGISLGFITQEQYEAVNSRMLALMKKEGVNIDHIEMCSEKYDTHPRRKPNPRMILDAAKRLNIDLESSIMVGDNINDIEAGKRAGVGKNLFVQEFISNPL
ncbi:HAD family hydrolase [Candidatus Micrarchaeota archaeon]|nr:HAD family hydrolase [Candidatus Micrarchaeota archaeon]